jgi:hypothetical protein
MSLIKIGVCSEKRRSCDGGKWSFCGRIAGYNKHCVSSLLVQSCALYYSSGNYEFEGNQYVTF